MSDVFSRLALRVRRCAGTVQLLLVLLAAAASGIGAAAPKASSLGAGAGASHRQGRLRGRRRLPAITAAPASSSLPATSSTRRSTFAWYFDDGSFQGSDITPGGTSFGGKFKVSGFGLTAGYLWNFAPAWSLHAQAGIASMRTRFDYATPFSGSVDKTTAQPLGGLSLGYAITPAVRIGLDYDVTRFKAHNSNGSMQTLGLSAQFAF